MNLKFSLRKATTGDAMLSGFFINITILISFIFLFHRLFNKAPLSPASSLKQKTAAGAASGGLGIVLMIYSIPIYHETIIDLRIIPVILMALFGGWLPAALAGVLIIAGRFIIDMSLSSAASFVLITASVVSCGLVHTLVRGLWKQAAWMVLVSNVYLAILLSFLLPLNDSIIVSIEHLTASLTGTAIAVYMFVHLNRVNQMFNRYQYQAYRDNLTNLYNQRAFQEMLQQPAAEYPSESLPLSLLVLDIDHFKTINDTYGHLEGDAVLKQISHVLRASIRPGDDAFRIGGEEFGVLLYDCDEEHALTIAERIRADIATTPFTINQPPGSLFLTVSIGSSTHPLSGQEISDLYSLADDALYTAKRQGRNCVCSSEAAG